MTITDYKNRIEEIVKEFPTAPAQIVVDDLGDTETKEQYYFSKLSNLSVEIRRIAWKDYAEAIQVARLADAAAAEIANQPVRQYPRWPAFEAGGIIRPAIQ